MQKPLGTMATEAAPWAAVVLAELAVSGAALILALLGSALIAPSRTILCNQWPPAEQRGGPYRTGE
jgi:hypothetical protein